MNKTRNNIFIISECNENCFNYDNCRSRQARIKDNNYNSHDSFNCEIEEKYYDYMFDAGKNGPYSNTKTP